MLDDHRALAGCRAGASPAPVRGEPWSWSRARRWRAA